MPPLTDVELAELEQLEAAKDDSASAAYAFEFAAANALPRLIGMVKELRRENADLRHLTTTLRKDVESTNRKESDSSDDR